jgi:hypothetical protein
MRSQESEVGIVARLRAEVARKNSSIPGKGKSLFSSQKYVLYIIPRAQPASYSVLFSEVCTVKYP